MLPPEELPPPERGMFRRGSFALLPAGPLSGTLTQGGPHEGQDSLPWDSFPQPGKPEGDICLGSRPRTRLPSEFTCVAVLLVATQSN